MKKVILGITAALLLTVSGLALANMDKDKGMMGGKMMGMCPMMQLMMQKQVVATGDGGIIVVGGNKITKYDKDLNVVKEVEQKMDMEGMQKMMKDCPMMGKGMMGNAGDDAETTAEQTAPAKEVDHASHH